MGIDVQHITEDNTSRKAPLNKVEVGGEAIGYKYSHKTLFKEQLSWISQLYALLFHLSVTVNSWQSLESFLFKKGYTPCLAVDLPEGETST